MAPNILASSYKQYKADTDSVASWLASNAITRGYPKEKLFPFKEANDRPGWVPSKKQKQKLASELPKHIIAMKNFVPLAQFIANLDKPHVIVPKSFSATLNRVITMRKRFPHQMEEQGIKTDAESNETHAHFLGILQLVWDTLKPRFSQEANQHNKKDTEERGKESTKKDDKNAFLSLPNAFAALELHEPSQAFLDAPDVTIERPQPAAGDTARYVAETPSDREEIAMAHCLLLCDLSQLREELVHMWQQYSHGNIDLAAAAVATNT